MKHVGRQVLVTGASSAFMGNLINILIDNNYLITAVSRDIKNVIKYPTVKWVECDLAKPEQDFAFLKGFDIVIHAAGISNSYNTNDYMLINYWSTKNLVDASIEHGIKRFIYISSILAGNTCGDYGLSKFKAEEYIKAKIDNWLIIRPSQLYGYSSTTPIDRLISNVNTKKIVYCPLENSKSIIPMYYSDLAKIIFVVAFQNRESVIIKYIVGPESFNFKELIVHFARILNKEIIIIPIPKFVMMAFYYGIKYIKLKIGIYPDQIYRFYNNRTEIVSHFSSETKISDYIHNKFSKQF